MTRFPKSIQRQEYLGVGLAMIAGYVDGFGLLKLKTFLSFMSGNTTQAGSTIGRGAFAPAVNSMTAIVFFTTGVFTGNLLRHAGLRQPRRVALWGVGALILVGLGACLSSLSGSVTIATISFAMGIMNTTLSHVGGEQVNLTFVTGALNRIARHLALAAMRVPLDDSQGPWDTQLRRALELICVWTGFFGGAVLAGIVTPRLSGWTLLPPAIVLLTLALFDRSPNQDEAIPLTPRTARKGDLTSQPVLDHRQ